MGKYLRNDSLTYLTITDKELDTINDKLAEVAKREADKSSKESDQIKRYLALVITYILRADGKGVQYLDYSEMKKAFITATHVEKLHINVRSQQNMQNHCGKQIELNLDSINDRSNFLIADDDNGWVEGTTKELIDIFNKYKNNNHILYSWWFVALFQLIGVTVIFLLCIWLSCLITPLLKIENAMIFTFIGFFLFFSNIWSFVLVGTKSYIEKHYAQIEFSKKSVITWLWQGILLILLGIVIPVLFKMPTRICQFLFK